MEIDWDLMEMEWDLYCWYFGILWAFQQQEINKDLEQLRISTTVGEWGFHNDVHIPRNCQWHEEDGEDKEPHHGASPGLEMEMEDVPDLWQKMTIECGKWW